MLLLSLNSKKLSQLWSFCRKKIIVFKPLFIPLVEFWNLHSGDWHWLIEKPRPVASLNRSLWRASVPSFSFYSLLALSSIISTLGLLANSVATIIGAMIIAPLMGPIIAMAYAMVVANRRLLRRSSQTLLTGVLLTILSSLLTAYLVGLTTVNSEIMARTNPSLIDLGVAMAAGAAGAFANSRRRIADALPGVAISVALVPPLSVVGIGLSLGRERLFMGASLLFLTNLTAIVFIGGLVFLWLSYGNLQKAQRGLCVSALILFLLSLPLGFSLRNILLREQVSRSVGMLIFRQTVTFSNTDIRTLRVEPNGDSLDIELEVAAGLDSISPYQINLVREFLEKELDKSVDLEVRVIPVNIFESPGKPKIRL